MFLEPGENPMSRCVGHKSEIKDIFDKSLKPVVLETIKKTIKSSVDKKKSKGIHFDDKCKNGWLLKVTILSLKADDAKSPKSLEAKASIEGLPLFGVDGFRAKGGAKFSGVNAKKIENDVKDLVSGVLDALMTKEALPAMLKK